MLLSWDSVVPGLWTVDHPFSCRKVVVVCMPRSHPMAQDSGRAALSLLHAATTHSHRPRSLPGRRRFSYPTAAHAESMPTAPPPNPGPVLRKINRGRWAAHCTAAAAASGARTLTPTDAADSGLRLLPVTQLVAAPVWSSARLRRATTLSGGFDPAPSAGTRRADAHV